MPRRERRDYPGAWWHVGNKGVAGRTLFTCDEERLRFVILLACAVRRGWIEVHAYTLMDNHFHLLVRSPNGQLSVAMQWIEDSYARWFNMRHGRRGPLFIGRYWGKLIHTTTYRRAVFAYIHANPERADMTIPPEGYRWSSKRDYTSGRERPWLTDTFGRRLSTALQDGRVVPAELVERWADAPGQDVRELDGLLGQRADRVQAWMRKSATLADGASRQRFLVRSATLQGEIEQGVLADPAARIRLGRRGHDAWAVLRAGMLRTASALSYQQIADACGIGQSTAHQRTHLHLRAVREDRDHAWRASRILERCLRREYEVLTV